MKEDLLAAIRELQRLAEDGEEPTIACLLLMLTICISTGRGGVLAGKVARYCYDEIPEFRAVLDEP